MTSLRRPVASLALPSKTCLLLKGRKKKMKREEVCHAPRASRRLLYVISTVLAMICLLAALQRAYSTGAAVADSRPRK